MTDTVVVVIEDSIDTVVVVESITTVVVDSVDTAMLADSIDTVVVVQPIETVVVVEPPIETVVAVASPARGPAGPIGPTGPSGGTSQYVHTQIIPAAVWTIEHNLGRRPAAVTVFSSDYSTEWAEFSIQHLDVSTLYLTADVPVSGVALIT